MSFKLWLESTKTQQFLEEYKSLTIPISNWIREYQGVQIGLDVPNNKSHAIYPDSVYLYEIVAKSGHGSDAMKMLTELADKYQIIIEAHVQPMHDKRLNENELLRWYGKFGFKKAKQEYAWDELLWHIIRFPKHI